MTYFSKADAVAKLTASKQDHSFQNLYSNNLLFNSTTIFYTNPAKTITAPAGNYVIPTNHNSIFMTLDSLGKIVGSISHTDGQSVDTTWIDDRIYSGGVLVSNQANIGGTDLTISGNVITDNVWTSRPYTNPKRWQINNGSLNTSALVNIDVSDMKGYDLMIYTGEYTNFSWVNWNWIQAFCHVKADLNRQSIFGNKIYYFKPDYWIPNSAFTGGVTYFRRMPNITTINDRYGRKKLWIDMAIPAHDIAENYGIPRTSTIMNKGISHSSAFNTYGYSYTPSSKDKKFTATGDFWVLAPLSWLVLGYVDVALMGGLMNEYYQNWVIAMIESLIVDDYTWANGSSPTTGFSYQTANPYHWTTSFGSGTNSGNNSPYQWLSGIYYASNELNGDQVQFNAEYYYKHSQSSIFAQAFEELKFNIKNQILYGINEIANGAVEPNFSAYGVGLYTTNGSNEWNNDSFGNPITPANVLSSKMYDHYHNYYINGTLNYSQIVDYKFALGSQSAYQMLYISNYQVDAKWQFQIYSIVHNYDITKKILSELWGTGDNFNRAMLYTWNRQEILGDAGNKNVRMNLPFLNGSRPDQSPSMNQSLGVWGMAYCDGIFAWNENVGMLFDEFETARPQQQLGRSCWDWIYVGYWQVWQNKDIVEAPTNWLVPQFEKSAGQWTLGNENYPIHLFANQRPICRYKLSVDGSTALVICTNPFNNGYTKATHTFRLPASSNYTFTIDTWGTYTSVVRLTGLPTS